MPSPVARWLLVVWAVALLTGCTDAHVPTTVASSLPVEDGATPTLPLDRAAVRAMLDRVMDPDGRALLSVIEPEEAIEATIDVAHARAVAAGADAAGFHAEVVNDGTALIVGRRDEVLVFAAGLAPTRIGIAEDHRVDRWLPDAEPNVDIPSPGAPYRFGGLNADLSQVTMAADRRGVLLSDLALTTVTIDGRAYERLSIEGSCDPGPPTGLLCQLWAHGSTVGAGAWVDDSLVVLETSTGAHRVDLTNRGSVPRALVRAAEWIARHDDAAGQVIGRYDTCCFARWDPSRPGVIAMSWTRECRAAARPAPVELADTGDCSDRLEIVVDVRRTSVVSINELAGP
jgi:hypothetical protein